MDRGGDRGLLEALWLLSIKSTTPHQRYLVHIFSYFGLTENFPSNASFIFKVCRFLGNLSTGKVVGQQLFAESAFYIIYKGNIGKTPKKHAFFDLEPKIRDV